MVACKVLVLDGEEHTFEVSKTSKVQDLFDAVCLKLEIVEKDYFSLTLDDKKAGKIWLNNSKKLGKYVINGSWVFSFEVKFYHPEPDRLQNELTRYQLFMQLRRDILSEKLPCSFLTLALLGSFAAQSELGDYDPAVNGKDFQYLRNISFAPKQTQELLEKIAELHITHRGQSSAEAENEFLNNAKKLSLYGVHIHDAKDMDNEDVQIGVCAAGLLVFKHRLRIHRFVWAKIIKILYKRNIFTIRIRPAEHERVESTFAFKLPSYALAKRLWKLAVEHHAFFRLKESDSADRSTFPRFSSKYRFSGRTQYQTSRDGAGAQPGNIRRGGQFKSMEGLTGYSTERAEEYQEDNRPPGATLTLRGRHKGSLPMLDKEDIDPSYDGSSYDGRKKAEQWNTNPNFDAYGTMSSVNPSVNGYPTNANDYQSRYANGTADAYRTGNRYNNAAPYNHPRLALGENDDDYGDDLPPYQDDHLSQKRGGVNSTNGQWNNQSGSTQVKTSTRTYVGPDGSIITEHRTEREGVIETQMRKVQREPQTPDFDYDKALSDAILAVTNVNTDLAVEKIEIQTKEEQRQRTYYDTEEDNEDDEEDDEDSEYGGPGETMI